MATAAYIIGMQKIASLASPKKRVLSRDFLSSARMTGQTGSYRFVGLVSDKRYVLMEFWRKGPGLSDQRGTHSYQEIWAQ
jgi:hypothetical protein